MSIALERAPQRLRALLPRHRAAEQARAQAMPHAMVTGLWILLTISVLAGWFALYATVLSGVQQHRDNFALYKQFRKSLALATVPIGQPIAPSTPIALIQLPAAGLPGEIVVEGTASSDLAKGVGHLRTSPLPGQPGVSVLYGRSLTYGGPFANIGSLAKGTKFSVTTGQGTFHYAVAAVRHIGDPGPTPLAPGGSGLMLETSTGSTLAPSKPLYVDATLLDRSVPSLTGPVASVPPSERAFGTDHSHLTQMIFWLQGLLVAVLLAIWAAMRWGRWQAWLVGIPVIFAVLWGASSNAMALLPNLV